MALPRRVDSFVFGGRSKNLILIKKQEKWNLPQNDNVYDNGNV